MAELNRQTRPATRWEELQAAIRACERLAYLARTDEDAAAWDSMAAELAAELTTRKES